MLEIGNKVGERYKILKLIGSGGMSNVYLGHDLILDRDVAVKVLRFDFRNNREALRRFQREALSATQLVHPNVVGVYDVDEEDGQQYIIMEYVPGTDLKQYIQTVGQASPQDAVHIMGQVLSAIALAHRNRIIHRDIKPQNLLIDQDNTIKVTDFGIAVALSDTSITQTNTLLGSVHYISPEQARGSVTTIKSDIYALGIVLYELLSGEVPFDGESAVSIALKHFQEPMPSVRAKNPAVPQSLENVILKATAKEPADRYDSCEDMLTDLESALSPNRASEAMFTPVAMLEETKVIEPIKTTSVSPRPAATQPKEVKKEVESPQGVDRNGRNGKKKKNGIILGILLFIVAIGIALAFVFANQEPDTVEIPAIYNVSESTARRLLEEARLSVGEIHEEYHDEIEAEYVIRSSPEVGESVPPDSTVDLYISMGTEPFTVDDYEGRNYQAVRDSLVDAGFIVERSDEYSEAENGTIIAQSIDPGEELDPKGTSIRLTVSMGEETFTMLDLSGYTRKSVEDYARGSGLEVVFEDESSDEVAEGLVISQTIAPRSNFTRGDTLTVTISTGPAEPEVITFSKTILIPYVAPEQEEESQSNQGPNENANSNAQDNAGSNSSSQDEPTANHVIIYKQDADHKIEDVFREFDILADREVTINFRIYEDQPGSYIVERDGEIIMQEENLTE